MEFMKRMWKHANDQLGTCGFALSTFWIVVLCVIGALFIIGLGIGIVQVITGRRSSKKATATVDGKEVKVEVEEPTEN